MTWSKNSLFSKIDGGGQGLFRAFKIFRMNFDEVKVDETRSFKSRTFNSMTRMNDDKVFIIHSFCIIVIDGHTCPSFFITKKKCFAIKCLEQVPGILVVSRCVNIAKHYPDWSSFVCLSYNCMSRMVHSIKQLYPRTQERISPSGYPAKGYLMSCKHLLHL